LIASRLVSMTFIPMLGYYLAAPGQEKTAADRRTAPPRLHWLLLPHGTLVSGTSMADLGGFDCLPSRGIQVGGLLKSAFFFRPISQFLSTVDIFLPNSSALSETTAAAAKVARNNSAAGAIRSM